MNRKEFIAEFAKENHLPKTQSSVIVSSVVEFLRKKIEEEDRLYIYGLGTFQRKLRASHRVVNPQNTKEFIEIPPTVAIVFTASPLNEEPEEEDEEDSLI